MYCSENCLAVIQKISHSAIKWVNTVLLLNLL